MIDCETIEQRLLSTGSNSPSPEELEEIRRHLETCGSCESEVLEVLEVRRLLSAHIPSEDLVDYAYGEIAEASVLDLIEGHLARCSSCRDELAVLRSDVHPWKSALTAATHLKWAAASLAMLALTASLLVLPGREKPVPQSAVAGTGAVAAEGIEQPERSGPATGALFSDGFESGSVVWSEGTSTNGGEIL